MKLLKTFVLSTALALAPLAAHAENFNFSYNFDANSTSDATPMSVTGSFSGTVVGSLIENISNFSVSLNGTAFTGTLLGAGWNGTAFDNSVAPVLSSDVSLDNFYFADTTATDPNYNNLFWFKGGEIFAVNFNADGFPTADETAIASKWSVNTVPVPEPSTYALLLAGLGLMTMVARRRSQR
ncbi:MAG TPA: PEP-CTERM sorting domain-containing protein [Burkholderiales bacterium]|jgi:hypothetical protein